MWLSLVGDLFLLARFIIILMQEYLMFYVFYLFWWWFMHSICNPYIYFVNTRILWSRVGIFKFDYLKSIKLSKGSSLFSHFTNTEGTTFLPGLLPATPGVSLMVLALVWVKVLELGVILPQSRWIVGNGLLWRLWTLPLMAGWAQLRFVCS